MDGKVEEMIAAYVENAPWPRNIIAVIYIDKMFIKVDICSITSKIQGIYTNYWRAKGHNIDDTWNSTEWNVNSDCSPSEFGKALAEMAISTDGSVSDNDMIVQRYLSRLWYWCRCPDIMITPNGGRYQFLDGVDKAELVCDYGVDVKSALIRK